MNALYMVCFVLALRQIPLFPRALLATWLLDIVLQFAIAARLGAAGLPADLKAPLLSFLDGNVTKVLIAMALWLPYLIVSNQVNLHFRHRIRAAG